MVREELASGFGGKNPLGFFNRGGLGALEGDIGLKGIGGRLKFGGDFLGGILVHQNEEHISIPL